MNAYIVARGPLHAEVLRRLLPGDLLEDVGIVAAANTSDSKSRGYGLLYSKRVPVAVALDADTLSEDLIHERKQNASDVFNLYAGGIPYRLVFAVPALEAVFFHDIAVLEKVFGTKIPDVILMQARYDPRAALEQLLAQSATVKDWPTLLGALTDEDLEALRQAPALRELIEFLQKAQSLARGRSMPATV